MSRRPVASAVVVAAALAAALAACPLPQPLPGIARPPDGGTIASPRIDTASVSHPETTIAYDTAATCAATDGGTFSLSARVLDANTEETVTVRWFVDYDPGSPPLTIPQQAEDLLPPLDPTQGWRNPAPFPFVPTKNWGPSPPHVVEIVISNQFAAPDVGPSYGRMPAPGYETQVFRWVFVPATGAVDGGCGP